MNKKYAIYPGSFDPWHKGHMEILKKALKIFDAIFIIVSINPDKDNQSNIDKRFNNVKEKVKDLDNVEVLINKSGFIADIARELNVNFIIRSARNNTDFNYELELAAGNKTLNNELETILIMPNYEDINYSSTLERHKEKLKNV
ncbi:pantetheine-phosphate adenylyltransferase [Mycoplasma anserisalpingitidis]|uniref:pantetheine-phosphate adenylyltransferase n=1 Tax=Mycoplasma anserisalpingitidis TaxID=519450 RepID=UPI0011B1AB40|nr:pantetheine-phosphate adenylyltransferase [Mycoplasma anserisalpingitidis]QDY87686.1 pantetheine-phosphate adenylyltransferase [Mycoplasma anserisalpingitidis]UCU27437.1 pantetheine-phosphate adenylyltransferase [Mycoplasma anserisalpingitidis]